jgi:FemAB-related protein (PEP-CTERM system-associated)
MTEILAIHEQPAWDGYIAGRSDALFSHRYAWGASLAEAYRLPIFRLAAAGKTAPGQLTGILPLMLFAAPERDVRLISLPYSDGAGIVADNPATGDRLLAAALELAEEQGAVHVELRQAGESTIQMPATGCADRWSHAAHTFKTGLRRSLPESPAELWPLLPGKARNQVRKARKAGCTARAGGIELLDDFYAVFSENMRDLGSPVHAPELFHLLLSQSLFEARIIAVYLESRPVAAAMVFRHGVTLFNPWASSLRRYRPECANMLLYSVMLDHAIDIGCRWFDFGRSSPDAATCRFKCRWGAVPQPLTWHVFSRKPRSWSPQSESLVDEAWKTLDLETSRQRGPSIRRWISL